MLVKINSFRYVLASDVVAIRKNIKTGSYSYGQWFADVKESKAQSVMKFLKLK